MYSYVRWRFRDFRRVGPEPIRNNSEECEDSSQKTMARHRGWFHDEMKMLRQRPPSERSRRRDHDVLVMFRMEKALR